jgi:hypothetical protein
LHLLVSEVEVQGSAHVVWTFLLIEVPAMQCRM